MVVWKDLLPPSRRGEACRVRLCKHNYPTYIHSPILGTCALTSAGHSYSLPDAHRVAASHISPGDKPPAWEGGPIDRKQT